MQFVISDLIARARMYRDDDHSDTDGWISPANWLTLFNVEYAQLYRRWVRGGLVSPAATDTSFTGGTTTVNGVLAVIGVGQDKGGYIRVLMPAQSVRGPRPFWHSSQAPTSISSSWMATGGGDNLTVTLDPQDAATETYFVRWVAAPAYFTDASSTVEIPYGCDERLVLGMARRSGLKDLTASALLERLITDGDAEMAFLAHGRVAGDSPRVRRVPRWQRSTRQGDGMLFPSDPRMWIYP
jgi:hypothetical protein